MDINVHHPIVKTLRTLDNGTFHTVELTEDGLDGRSQIALFIDRDWSQWDAIVAAVTEYRDAQTREHYDAKYTALTESRD